MYYKTFLQGNILSLQFAVLVCHLWLSSISSKVQWYTYTHTENLLTLLTMLALFVSSRLGCVVAKFIVDKMIMDNKSWAFTIYAAILPAFLYRNDELSISPHIRCNMYRDIGYLNISIKEMRYGTSLMMHLSKLNTAKNQINKMAIFANFSWFGMH